MYKTLKKKFKFVFLELDKDAMLRGLEVSQYILESIIILLLRIRKDYFLLVGILESYD